MRTCKITSPSPAIDYWFVEDCAPGETGLVVKYDSHLDEFLAYRMAKVDAVKMAAVILVYWFWQDIVLGTARKALRKAGQ